MMACKPLQWTSMNPPASESFCSQEELSVQTTGYEERQKWPDDCSSIGEWEPCMQSHHHQNKTELRNTITGDKDRGMLWGGREWRLIFPENRTGRAAGQVPPRGSPHNPLFPRELKWSQRNRQEVRSRRLDPSTQLANEKLLSSTPILLEPAQDPECLEEPMVQYIHSYNAHIWVETACRKPHVADTECTEKPVLWKWLNAHEMWRQNHPSFLYIAWCLWASFLLQPTSTCGNIFFPQFSYL